MSALNISEAVRGALAEFAERRPDVQIRSVTAGMELWPNSSCGFGGIGGQMFTECPFVAVLWRGSGPEWVDVYGGAALRFSTQATEMVQDAIPRCDTGAVKSAARAAASRVWKP